MLEILIVFLFVTPIITAFVSAIFIKTRIPKILCLFTSIFVFISILFIFPHISNTTITYSIGEKDPSITSINGYVVRILLNVDSLSLFFALITSIVFLNITIFSFRFLKGNAGIYFTLLQLLLASMLIVEFSSDLFNIFVFFELSSIVCAVLISYYKKRENFEASLKFMIVASLIAVFMLISIGILYYKYGSFNIAYISNKLNFDLLDKVVLAMLVCSFLMKCGTFPMHQYIADAYQQAPAPVSAMLVVNSQLGLYLLYRTLITIFWPHSVIIAPLIVILGSLSMFIGVTMAIVQKDVKRLMAYHAISQTGYMTLALGVGMLLPATNAIIGSLFHIFNHAMYKPLLFLCAGYIVYTSRTQDIRKIGGFSKNTFFLIIFLIAFLSISGIPPFNGFSSKLIIYESVFFLNPFLTALAMFVSVLTLASFLKVFSAIVGGNVIETKISNYYIIPFAILSFIITVFGLFPNIFINNIAQIVAKDIFNTSIYIGGVLK